MLNADVIDLYSRVDVGTTIIVVPNYFNVAAFAPQMSHPDFRSVPSQQVRRVSMLAMKQKPRVDSEGSGRSVETGRSVLTSKADEYRAKAQECEERAEQTRDPFIKQQMIEIAQKWHTMAAHEEKYGR